MILPTVCHKVLIKYSFFLIRCLSLKESSDDLPCSFLLLQVSGNDAPKVVGYSHLCKVLQRPKSVLIESGVVFLETWQMNWDLLDMLIIHAF